jgi:HK97 gp10 family phage protein
MAKFKIEGMEELQKTIKKLGELPQKCVTKAARKGSKIALNSAKQNAPVDTGSLKRGLSQKGERTKTKGKKVYQVTFNKGMNDVFTTESKSGKRGYYPAAQEYGFFARNGRYIPGFHYMKKSIEGNNYQIEREIVDVLSKEIDKLK